MALEGAHGLAVGATAAVGVQVGELGLEPHAQGLALGAVACRLLGVAHQDEAPALVSVDKNLDFLRSCELVHTVVAPTRLVT
jgi:hypothetical protein